MCFWQKQYRKEFRHLDVLTSSCCHCRLSIFLLRIEIAENASKQFIIFCFVISDHFSDWFEPGTQLAQGKNNNNTMNRRSNRRKNLHQKLGTQQF